MAFLSLQEHLQNIRCWKKKKNKIKKIITDLDGKNYRWYQSYDENLGEDLYLLIVKWFNKKRAWSSYDFSFLISKFIKL